MKKFYKVLLCIAIVVAVLGALVYACHKSIWPYDEDDIIGLTAEQIQDRYGPFDIGRKWDPGKRPHGRYGYYVREERVGFFGTDPPVFFIIYLNECGIAEECAYELGGEGG